MHSGRKGKGCQERKRKGSETYGTKQGADDGLKKREGRDPACLAGISLFFMLTQKNHNRRKRRKA